MDGNVSGVADFIGTEPGLDYFEAVSDEISHFMSSLTENEEESESNSGRGDENEIAREGNPSCTIESGQCAARSSTRNAGAYRELPQEATPAEKAKFAIEEFLSGAFDNFTAACVAIGISKQIGNYHRLEEV